VMFFGAVWRQARLEGSSTAKRIAPWLLGGILAIIFPISIIGYNHDFGFHERWDSYVSCYTMAILVFVICTTKMRLSGRPFVWLGKISYSIYLVHPLVASAAIQAGYGPEAVAMNPLVFSVVLVAVVILVAWITYSVIEYPAIRFGKRVAARREVTLQQPAALQIAAQKAG
jgi:peptidoglycan/LPS O-acetylase OafA/YrhL